MWPLFLVSHDYYFCIDFMVRVKKNIARVILIVILFVLVNYSPDNTEGNEPVILGLTVSGSRILNSFSEGEEFAWIDRTVTSFMRKWEIHGASVAIARNGRLFFAKGYGNVDDTGGERIEPYNRFRIASVSKLVTAAAVMKLVEVDSIGLNDKVFGADGILNDEYFLNPRDNRVDKITVAHLLSHQGGWTTRWGDQMFMPYVVASALKTETPVSTREIVRFALDKRLHFTPGTGRSYSNLGYAILGLVIEKVSGQSYEDYCRDKLLLPLGIYDFELGHNLYEDRDPLEVRYYEPENSVLRESIYDKFRMVPASYGGNDIEALGGAGGWITTAPDLLRFVLSVDGMDSRPDILSEASIKYMTTFGNGASPVGWKATTSNGYWWRTGSFAGTSAMVRRQPDGITWVVLFNTNTWKQSMFPSDISKMMSRALGGLKYQPDIDLFEYQLPVPVSATKAIK